MRYLSLIPILLAAACTYQRPISSAPSVNNKDYKVEYLFEHEGCKVYRFLDGGTYVYFTNCNGEITARTDSTSVKNIIRAPK